MKRLICWATLMSCLWGCGDSAGTGSESMDAGDRQDTAMTSGASDTQSATDDDAATEDSGAPERDVDGDTDEADTPPAVDSGAEDSSQPTEDTRPPRDVDNTCVAISASAEQALLPVDIIWIVDASPSMDVEIALIEANLNRFAERIGASGLDYRVVLIGSDQDYCGEAQCYLEICVPTPLSGAEGCPDTDGLRYRHVRQGVHSRDGLDVFIANASNFLDFLRPEALSHIVMVTDDNTGFGADADEFQAFINAQAPRFSQGWRFHSVVDLVGYVPGCGVFDDEECSCGEERGETYIELSVRTDGLVQSVCQEDWTPVFEALEAQVREGTQIPCAFQLPPPDEGRELDPESVNVAFLSADRSTYQLIPQVTGPEACAAGRGWYYDDPTAPTFVYLCPEICGVDVDIIEIEIGCQTIKY